MGAALLIPAFERALVSVADEFPEDVLLAAYIDPEAACGTNRAGPVDCFLDKGKALGLEIRRRRAAQFRKAVVRALNALKDESPLAGLRVGANETDSKDVDHVLAIWVCGWSCEQDGRLIRLLVLS